MAWVVSQLQMTSGCLRGNHPRPCPVTPDTPRGSSLASLSMYFQTVISSKSTCLPLILLIYLFWLCRAFLVTWASRCRAEPSAAAARGLSGRGSPAVAQGLSCFLRVGSSRVRGHRQADSLVLSLQGSSLSCLCGPSVFPTVMPGPTRMVLCRL